MSSGGQGSHCYDSASSRVRKGQIGFANRLMRTIREEEIDLSEPRDFADAYGQFDRVLDDAGLPH